MACCTAQAAPQVLLRETARIPQAVHIVVVDSGSRERQRFASSPI
jgi:hypothetical protein